MSANLNIILNQDEDCILPILRLARWASEASPTIDELTFLRDHVPEFRKGFDRFTPELTFPDVRNTGHLVAGVLAVVIDLLESRAASSEGEDA